MSARAMGATMAAISPTTDWASLRRLFPILEQRVYFSQGNVGACPTPVREAMEGFLATWDELGDDGFMAGFRKYERAKELFAALVNASPEAICAIPETTTGINIAAQIIDPKPGSNVVVHELSYTSAVYPWLDMQKRGVEVRFAPAADGGRVPMDGFERLIDARTAAVCVCHVGTDSGVRLDLRSISALASRHGAAVVVDAAQSAGVVSIDVQDAPVDFLAAPTFKWLMGPIGAGFLYVRPDRIQATVPPIVGHGSVTNARENDLHAIQYHATARRFEPGILSLIPLVGACAGLELIASVGLEQIQERTLFLSDRVRAGLMALTDRGVLVLSPDDRRERAGLMSFTVRDHTELHAHLEGRGIHAFLRPKYIRVDTCFYNTEEDVDRLLAEVATFLDRG